MLKVNYVISVYVCEIRDDIWCCINIYYFIFRFICEDFFCCWWKESEKEENISKKEYDFVSLEWGFDF